MSTVSKETMEYISDLKSAAKAKAAPKAKPAAAFPAVKDLPGWDDQPKPSKIAVQLHDRVNSRSGMKWLAFLMLAYVVIGPNSIGNSSFVNFHCLAIKVMVLLLSCTIFITNAVGAGADFIVKAVERNGRRGEE